MGKLRDTAEVHRNFRLFSFAHAHNSCILAHCTTPGLVLF